MMTFAFVALSVGVAVAVAASSLSGAEVCAPSRPLAEFLGVTHAGGKYSIPTRDGIDFLNEGVDRIVSLGARSVKLWFTDNPTEAYPNFSGKPELDWPATGKASAVKSMSALAATPFYERAFARPEITTVFLEATEFARAWWRDGVSTQESDAVAAEFRELTEHLMRRWKGTAKTFVLQNWEADNALNLHAHPEAKWQQITDGFIDYIKARQRGVEQGRAAVKNSDVKVWNALEINWNWPAIDHKYVPVPEEWTALNKVVREGFTRHGLLCDLYSWSCWSAKTLDTAHNVLRGIDYMRERVPAEGPLAPDNLFFGEFGTPEKIFKEPGQDLHTAASDEAHSAVHEALFENIWRGGARCAVVWELYCNEPRDGVKFDPRHPVSLTERQLGGHWLVRPPTPPEFPAHSVTGAWFRYAALCPLHLYSDELISLSHVNARSEGWEIASEEEPWAGGDRTRVRCVEGDQPAYLDYAVRGELRDWNIKAFVHASAGDPSGTLRGRLSADGKHWSEPFPFAIHDAVALAAEHSEWNRVHFKPKSQVPRSQRFLRIELNAPARKDGATQIGSVSLIATEGSPLHP